MSLWYHPFVSPLFLTGIIINVILAFFLLCAVRNRGLRVWVPILVAMFIVGAIQAAYVLTALCKESPAADPVTVAIQTGIPLVELEPFDSSSSDEDNNNEQ